MDLKIDDSVLIGDFICRGPCVFAIRSAIIDGFDAEGVTSCRATR